MAYVEDENGDFVTCVPEGFSCGSNPLKEKEKQLFKDYQAFNLPNKIIERAVKIYMIVLNGITFKQKKRRSMMCKCAYEAYKENNIAKDPILLAIKFDIEVKKLRDAQDEFYGRLHAAGLSSQFPKKHLNAHELLPDVASALEAKDVPFDDLSILIESLYASSMLLNRVSPRDISISTIHWYVNRDRQTISFERTQSITLIAHATLVKIVNAIQQLVK